MGAEIQQSPFFCGLLDPGVIIAVAVENDPLVGLDGLLDQVMERGLKIRHTLQPVGKFLQRFLHGCVEHDIGTGDRIGGAHHTELKFVACEGKGGGPVAVRSVTVNLGNT